MAAPILQAQGSVAVVTTGNLTVVIPTGEQADDILVATLVAWVPNTSTGANTVAAPNGWTKFTPDVTTVTGGLIDAEYSFFWKRATSSSETNPTFTRPSGWDTGTDTVWAGRIYVIQGCITTGDPWDAITNTSISTASNPAFPAITVLGDQRLAMVFAVKTDDTALPTAATGWTAGTFASTTTGTDASFRSYRINSTNTSTSVVTPTGGSAPNQGGTVYFGVSFEPPVSVVSRTATGSGTGSQTADVLVESLRTATGSGTGSQTAVGLVTGQVVERTATGSGSGTESVSGVVTRLRIATGSGVCSQTAVGLVTAQIIQRIATGSGLGTDAGVGVVVHLRTATGLGVGTQTADDLVTRLRTATGSGLGTESAEGVVIDGSVQRTALGSGVGGSSATNLRTVLRTGSNAGVSSGLVVGGVLIQNDNNQNNESFQEQKPSYPGGINPWSRKQSQVAAAKTVQTKQDDELVAVVSAKAYSIVIGSGIAIGQVSWSILEDEAELLLLI